MGAAAAGILGARSARNPGRKTPSRRNLSFVFLCLSWAVGCGTILLIVPPKELLSDRAIWIWAAVWCVLGFLSAVFPGQVGIPLAVLALCFPGLSALEASVWHVRVPGREIARLVLYQVGSAGTAGDLSVPDRNAVPVLSRVVLTGRECSLEARVLDLAGPLACLFGPRRYALLRLVDARGVVLMEFPGKARSLTALLGGKDLSLPWISIRTVRSPVFPLETLRPLSWSFDEKGGLTTLSF